MTTHDTSKNSTTPNPILEGVELREAYARVREALEALTFEVRCNREPLAGPLHQALARADEALKATPLIGLSQGEGDEAHDWVTHRRAWRDGLVLARDFACEGSEDPEADRMYWQHEIDVFDRTFAALSTVQDGSVREEGPWSNDDENALHARAAALLDTAGDEMLRIEPNASVWVTRNSALRAIIHLIKPARRSAPQSGDKI